MIAIGRIDAKTRETSSSNGKSHRLFNDNTRDIKKNRGMQRIGGFVNVEIVLAILNFEFIIIL
ncbi:MAG: hypothetical protein E7Z74_06435 [Methanobrevibacter millerae]|uniref:Uncharacterized protein n=1 Tax=Methanobrevibacter millerae TaxID=230361 RepID=A0A8T3VS62_9EURY|nr:hypothetical protein [Methanobrevibacter millerae]